MTKARRRPPGSHAALPTRIQSAAQRQPRTAVGEPMLPDDAQRWTAQRYTPGRGPPSGGLAVLDPRPSSNRAKGDTRKDREPDEHAR
jgi:hypothetical protein